MNDTLQHLDEGLLQALADGEVPPAKADRLEAHLAECAGCRAELDALRQASLAVTAALRELDRRATEIPALRGRQAARRAAADRSWGVLPRAAVLVLGLAGAASAAVPGSPVRAWLESLVGGSVGNVAVPVAEAPAPTAVADPPEAGVSIAPEAKAVRVVLGDIGPGVLVTATLTEGGRAGVYATGAAAEARFTTGRGRIDVVGASSGTLRVEIPRDAVSATVVVNGRVYVEKERDSLRVSAPDADSAGTEVSFRVR